MNHFLSVNDVSDLNQLVKEALIFKKVPTADKHLGKNRTLGLLFFNSSLRTRLSTQRAAQNLGMEVIVMNVGSEGWSLEMEDGIIMDGDKPEHVKEAAAVVGQYCDIIGIRSFAGLTNRLDDYNEKVLTNFVKYCKKPILNLESATRHPLQSLADLITINELKAKPRPKVVLTWAPHVKALPQAVPNSFAEWMNASDVEFVIANPEGYDLHPDFVGKAKTTHNQAEAFKNADFIYAKNWSSYTDYGQILSRDAEWMVNTRKMDLTNNAKFMHCLPVRRNLIVSDEVIDSPNSVVIHQAGNRLWATQAVLKMMILALMKKESPYLF
ncbi:MAG: N-acetylornithine carbamoyltransferase [Bacteroidota bacterium]